MVNKRSGRVASRVTDADAIVAIPQGHWPRKISAVVVGVSLLSILWTFASAKTVQWDQVASYLTFPTILSGALLSVELTLLSMAAATIIGIVGAMMRLSQNRLLRFVAWLYVWVFRGTPLLVQIIFWFNLALFIPRIGIGDWSISTNEVMTSFAAAFIALSLNCGANMTEIVRGGLLAVDTGQAEAAIALGMSRLNATVRIVLPQALRVIVPAAGNQLIGVLKDTALVSVIAAQELLTQAQVIYNRTYLVIELLIVASAWYLLMTSIATLAQQKLEQRLNMSVSGLAPTL